jgi:hypothetical protein
MLRHFEQSSSGIEEELLSKGYALKDIRQNLTLPGSRFDAYFAKSINELLDRFFVHSTYSITSGLNGNLLIQAAAHTDEFLDGIGTYAVVPKSSIDSLEQSNIYWERNRDINLMHLDIKQLPRTHEFTVVLKPANAHYIFITAFPGSSAMPLPDHTMSKKLYQECRDFWDAHVFLNAKNFSC